MLKSFNITLSYGKTSTSKAIDIDFKGRNGSGRTDRKESAIKDKENSASESPLGKLSEFKTPIREKHVNGHISADRINGLSNNKNERSSPAAYAFDVSVRKKYATKLANFLLSAEMWDKKRVQEIASKIEKKILISFQSSPHRYGEAFKILYRLLKVLFFR